MKRLPFLSALTCLTLCPMTALAQTTWLAAGSGDGFSSGPRGDAASPTLICTRLSKPRRPRQGPENP